MAQHTTPTSLRDQALEALGGPPTPFVACPTPTDVETPTSPAARAAMAAAVTTTRFRVNTDLCTLVSTDQAKRIAKAAVSAYLQTFHRIESGGGL